MRFCTILHSYPSQSLYPVRMSAVYNTCREISWPFQCCSYIWSTSAPVCHHLKIVSHDIGNIVIGTLGLEPFPRYPELMLPVSLRVAFSGNEWSIMWLWKNSYAYVWVSNGVLIDRWLERMNNWEVRLMESVADLRKQRCEEQHKLRDCHGTMWHRLMCGW